ncbi:MAG: metal-dependent hydrolase [Bacteroidia bacterium]|nr:metal-dependent hydrolase [Bacteroidia bacterium]MDW8236350.1 metal-dependent hydrolase [Bacteroidia bacterium]
MRIHYLGHSAFLITTSQGEKLLLDPFISNPLAQNKGINPLSIQPDYIFLSHAHFDHIADVEAIAQKYKVPIIGVYEVCSYFERKGLAVVGMNVGGKWRSEKTPDTWVKLVPAIHSSSFPDGSYGGVAVGFVLSDGKYTIYYSGDTSLTLEMEIIGERYDLTLAILCIGGHFTMDYEDAVEAAFMLGVDHVVGMHYNTFPPIQISSDKAQQYFRENDLKLHLLEVGEEKTIEELVKGGD